MQGPAIHRNRYAVRAACACLAVWLALSPCARAAEPSDQSEIAVTADFAQEWEEGGERISILRGNCRITQGATSLEAAKMVIWRSGSAGKPAKRDHLDVYLEDSVKVEWPGSTLNDSPLLMQVSTRAGVTMTFRQASPQPVRQDPLLERAGRTRRNSKGKIMPVSRWAQGPGEGPELHVEQFKPAAGNLRRIFIRPRSQGEFNAQSSTAPNTTPAERITIITGGVNIRIEGIDRTFNGEPLGTIDLSADRMVIWSRNDVVSGAERGAEQQQDEPFEVYMEGNIEILQGDPAKPEVKRRITASHATFDARENKALILNAELQAFVPQLQGNLRVRAERIQQLGQNAFHAQRAWVTASPYGKPGYRFQSSDLFLEERPRRSIFGNPDPELDPLTGAVVSDTTNWITANNNTFFIEDVPVFYVPRVSVPAEDPNIPIRNVTVGTDNVFGTQVRATFDLAKVFGFEPPDGTRWDLLTDYFSDRGPGIGAGGQYHGVDLFGAPGQYKGDVLGYYVHDEGKDNLGLDRRTLIPETENRGRLEARHRQTFPEGFTAIGERGYLSDRNFLEQYYELEFDRGKDVETLGYVKQQNDNWAWSGLVRPDINGFENTTEWLPRGDLHLLSEPLFDGWLTWSSHTSGGYAQLHRADPPSDPNDTFTPLPYIIDADGAVLMTRHELNAPFGVGPVRVVPYLMGEAAFWGDSLNGGEIDRFTGVAGIRSTLEMSRAFPDVHNWILNVNGLAHRVLFEAGYSFTESTESLSNIAQFNEFDDDAQERFRMRLIDNTYGGVLPPTVEPRFYAVRNGAGMSVTAPWHELIDDQQVARFAIRQKLQTKVGPPDRMRIRDWMTLDLEASYFPESSRDNFGEDFGLLGARYAWHVGSRTSILANAAYDLFDDAQQLWNVGLLSQRSERGSIYLGLRQVKGGGALDSQIVTASYSYQMSPKWISTFGTAYDIGESRNAGQSFTVTRVGLDFLFHLGANFDASKGNTGIAISVEPKIGGFGNSTTQLSNLLQGRRQNQ